MIVYKRGCALCTSLFSDEPTVITIAMEEALQEPALRIPSTVVSQFPTTRSDEQVWYYVAATLSAVVPGILVLLRLYTKSCIVHQVDLVDCSILSSGYVARILTKT